MTPNGEEALVHLELRMSTFFGYNNSGDVASELAKLRYLGSQCHGIMWPAAEMATLPDWPVAPPIVAGKVGFCKRCVLPALQAIPTLATNRPFFFSTGSVLTC